MEHENKIWLLMAGDQFSHSNNAGF